MKLEILESFTDAGGAVNEDVTGHVTKGDIAAAWVLDGATGLADQEYVAEGPTDAAWVARTLSRCLAREIDTGDVSDYFSRALTATQADYEARVSSHAILPSWALPSAAGVSLRASASGLDLAWMGDCVGVILADGLLTTVAAGEDSRSDNGINQVVAATQARNPTPQLMRIVLQDQLRANRARLNRPGGYWMFGVDPRAIAGLNLKRLALPDDALILLCSDGFWRLVDHFGIYDAAGLLQAAQEQGLASLGRHLRQLEMQDPEGRRVPRVKPHDDATAILLRFGRSA